MVLTAVAWLAFVVLAGLLALLAVQRHRWAQREQLARSLGIASAITGSLAGWAVAAARPGVALLLAGIAVGVGGMLLVLWRVWQDVKAHQDRTVADSLAAAATALGAALKDARARAAAARADRRADRPSGRPPLRLAPPLDAPPSRDPARRRAAPPPLPPDADLAPGPERPRFAVVSAVIPPDHAAAHQRIASFEPEGLRAHADFLTREARAFAGYADAFGAYADGLIHGPGVPPQALRAIFDFAGMFADVGGNLNLALKQFHAYFQGHMEWTESHDPARDGHWTIRD